MAPPQSSLPCILLELIRLELGRMEPAAIVAFTSAVIGQISLITVRYRPAFDLVLGLVDCLMNSRPPPPQATIAEEITHAIEERLLN
ncbi:hypothetical protein Sjap_016857 [Stephania japonica]|uniref:Uncharacterized protein n=1 Tax=Stephania japonica TaxID=461633 RepID=A0AAP0I528_9MAGN